MDREQEGVTRLAHLRLGGAHAGPREGAVVVEEPLEIRLDTRPIAVVMRTPGNDIELVLGFLVTEGIVSDPGVILQAAHCDETRNVVEVRSEPGAPNVHPPAQRNFFASSSCGACGKASIDALRVRAPGLGQNALRVGAERLRGLPGALQNAQDLFGETGSLHGVGLFEADGTPSCVREDVGRHNAVDKVVGWAALNERLPLSAQVLMVSGRVGFEIVQKAWVAGIPIVCAISGPSSLAVELAREAGMTLVAFLRGQEMNVYGAPERIVGP